MAKFGAEENDQDEFPNSLVVDLTGLTRSSRTQAWVKQPNSASTARGNRPIERSN